MDLRSKRLSIADTRLEIIARTEADLWAQFLELIELREQLWEAQVAAGEYDATGVRRRASVSISVAA